MNKLTGMLLAGTLTLGVVTDAKAQDEKTYYTYPHMFVGLQGGVQTTRTDYDMTKLMTPAAAVSFGAYFNRVVGTRLHVGGLWNKSALANGFEYEYKYVTTDLDLLLNVTNIFRSCDDHFFNLILLGGVGLNTAWGNDDINKATAYNANMPYMWDGTHLTHNARVGAQINLNCSKHIDVNLEVNANSLGDRYNSKASNKDDWQFNAMAGIAYKFGHKKKPVIVPKAVEEIWATRIDTTWYDDVTYVDEPIQEEITYNIHYPIRGAAVGLPSQQIDAVVAFVKSHKDCKVSVTGYADKGTGNPRVNMKYSKQRTENVVRTLVERGVPAEIIVSDYKGDTVQPFPEDNDKNRVAITTAAGTGTKKKEVKERKFKTKEVRYRVQ